MIFPQRAIARTTTATLGALIVLGALWLANTPSSVAWAQPQPTGKSLTEVPPEKVPEPKQRPEDAYKFDKNHLYLNSVTDFGDPKTQADQINQVQAYCDLVMHARKFPQNELEQHAVVVPWKLLMVAERESYRYELLKFEGQLFRVLKFDAPAQLANQGVSTLYEAWLFTEKEEHAICLIFSELPEGLTISKQYEPPKPAIITGYYFRSNSYTSEKKNEKTERNEVRRAPYMIGRSITYTETSRRDASSFVDGFLPGILISVALLSALVLGLVWWFRSSDRAGKAAIRRRRENPELAAPDTNLPADFDSPFTNIQDPQPPGGTNS